MCTRAWWPPRTGFSTAKGSRPVMIQDCAASMTAASSHSSEIAPVDYSTTSTSFSVATRLCPIDILPSNCCFFERLLRDCDCAVLLFFYSTASTIHILGSTQSLPPTEHLISITNCQNHEFHAAPDRESPRKGRREYRQSLGASQ